MGKIFTLLKTPPPFGGGEILHGYIRDDYSKGENYIVLEISSLKRNKADQSLFKAWKVIEFATLWFRTISILVGRKPELMFMGIGKAFPHFFRDSLLLWTAWILRIPVAVELHGVNFYFLDKGRAYEWYGRFVLSRVKSIRVLGKSIANRLRTHDITNTVVIDNGVRVGEVPKSRKEKGSDRKPKLLFVGALSANKGFDVLVEAAAALQRLDVRFDVHCIGEWISKVFKREIEKTLDRHQLENAFIFHGVKHGPEKWNVYSRCDILVLPSRFEGQPLVILEACAYGLAVVASAVGAIPDTLENNVNGFLTPPGDAGALCAAIKPLLTDGALRERMGEKNKKLFKKRFSLDVFLKAHEAWLSDCAKR